MTGAVISAEFLDGPDETEAHAVPLQPPRQTTEFELAISAEAELALRCRIAANVRKIGTMNGEVLSQLIEAGIV